MNEQKSTFEEQIRKHGYLVYRNVGDSMLPILRQGKDLMVISRKPEDRLKKYDVPLYKRDNGQYVLHRILKVRKTIMSSVVIIVGGESTESQIDTLSVC